MTEQTNDQPIEEQPANPPAGQPAEAPAEQPAAAPNDQDQPAAEQPDQVNDSVVPDGLKGRLPDDVAEQREAAEQLAEPERSPDAQPVAAYTAEHPDRDEPPVTLEQQLAVARENYAAAQANQHSVFERLEAKVDSIARFLGLAE